METMSILTTERRRRSKDACCRSVTIVLGRPQSTKQTIEYNTVRSISGNT